MKENLVKLYNTLSTIETKGESSKTMADCLRFLENLVRAEDQSNVESTPVEE